MLYFSLYQVPLLPNGRLKAAWVFTTIRISPPSDCKVINPGGFFPFEMWVLYQPGVKGIICSELMACYPSNVIQSTVIWNDPIISVMLGSLPTGLSICYISCQWDWTWICHQMCYLTDTVPGFIEVCQHPDVGVYQFANCDPGYKTEPIVILNHLALNQPCVVATEDASWGAIKALINE